MNVGFQQAKHVEPPRCYGDPKYWNSNAPECAGGADASYVNPQTGKNVRYPCDFFHSCGTRVTVATGGFIPPERLVRPQPTPSYQPVGAPPRPTQSPFAEFVRRIEDHRTAAVGVPQPPVFAQPPGYQPNSPWTTNYTIPSFLTAQEERHPGESWWAPLMRALLRGLLKGAFHVGAHWFDVHVLKPLPALSPPEQKG